MLEIMINNAQIAVGTIPGQPGIKVIQFLDPESQIKITIPMPEESAKMIAAQLSGSNIVVANGPLKS